MSGAKRGRGDFPRLGYMRPNLSPEVVAALIAYSERLQAERDGGRRPAGATAMPAGPVMAPAPSYDNLLQLKQHIEDEEERKCRELRAQWQLGDYVGACPRCGRIRLCQCPNGKRRCEKCNWCPEDGTYAPDV